MSDSPPDEGAEDFLDADDAAEEILQDDDHPVEGEDDAEDDLQEEIQLQNDSVGHFDSHTDSIFCIAQHPLNPSLIVTGGGDDVAYLFDTSTIDNEPGPVFPTSYESNPQPKGGRKSIPPLQKLDGHTDSVNAVAFTLPSGDFLVTAGLDGKLCAWSSSSSSPTSIPTYTFLSESSEVEEINWVSPCPSPSHPNTLALGASDGSVWVYTLPSSSSSTTTTTSTPTITQAYYLHTSSCTAGSWTPDGNLLATISEDSSFYVHDVWGIAASTSNTSSNQPLISLTASDQRFAIDGGLYSIAISPSGTIAAVGGAGGHIRVIGLPRLTTTNPNPSSSSSAAAKATTSQAGSILASLQTSSESIETLSFSTPPLTLLAAGRVDGGIALFDVAHRFALRRSIGDAHDGFAVVKVEFVGGKEGGRGHFLTSAGMDGVVRRWDCRGGSAPGTAAVGGSGGAGGPGQGFVREWKGHRGDGEGGGVLGFVQGGGGERIVTAGDDGVALVFRAGFE